METLKSRLTVVLETKYKLGLFDNPINIDRKRPASTSLPKPIVIQPAELHSRKFCSF